MFWLKDATLLNAGETGYLRESCAQLNLVHRDEHPDFLISTESVLHAANFQNIA